MRSKIEDGLWIGRLQLHDLYHQLVVKRGATRVDVEISRVPERRMVLNLETGVRFFLRFLDVLKNGIDRAIR